MNLQVSLGQLKETPDASGKLVVDPDLRLLTSEGTGWTFVRIVIAALADYRGVGAVLTDGAEHARRECKRLVERCIRQCTGSKSVEAE